MSTFTRFRSASLLVPASTSWYLADLGEFRGKQALYTRQSPQRLKTLREHALIESSVSSNRIEGVVVETKRVRELVLGRPLLRDRDEEEVRGYRDALQRIHEEGASLPVTEKTVRELHRLARGEIWDAGKYKEKDSDIIERSPDGTERIRFQTVPAKATPRAMKELLHDWNATLKEKKIHPLIALAAFNLDFLCIHPFRDGNGRVSRLLLLLQCYHLGYEVGRYISLERLIEQNKDRYYETLEHSCTVPRAGMRTSMTHGLTSIMFFSSSKAPTASSSSAWARCERQEAQKQNRCCRRYEGSPPNLRFPSSSRRARA